MMSGKEWGRWVERKPFDQREAWRAVACFLRWVEHLEKNGRERSGTFNRFLVNASHSALLRRLVEGKEPFAFPPPLRHGYPWYELLETGRGEVCEVCESSGNTNVTDLHCPYLSISGSPWTVLEKRSDAEYAVTYREGGEPFLLWRQDHTVDRWTIVILSLGDEMRSSAT